VHSLARIDILWKGVGAEVVPSLLGILKHSWRNESSFESARGMLSMQLFCWIQYDQSIPSGVQKEVVSERLEYVMSSSW
jgi:hypothetical protein